MTKVKCKSCNMPSCNTRKLFDPDIDPTFTRNALDRCDFYTGPDRHLLKVVRKNSHQYKLVRVKEK